ncbi:hypothetical protein GOV03_05170 [Candidatus Woesearchaeota archaeon]|nr:hypothetical protein [Candidatus Woesearchaeota archaeon]
MRLVTLVKMDKLFDDEDLGKRVLIAFDPHKVDASDFDSEEYKIPYGAMMGYQFQVKVIGKSQPRIKVIGKSQKRVNPIEVALGVGVGRMVTLGDLIEIAEDYFVIKKVKNKRRPY